ncbi:helix-turn-helix domain-containing protein [Actinophytocola sp.]|uniref:ArsR/SmtB family transcription factor n=1 Tax=Actinophytocola sp. TaxID=1872138 RepID=UPI002D7FCDC0|nr:helix-turn-helix domain-containing protein [Actinophytocola sp.]HET9138466.1 helix-turn-helix domain-containing protein [Actinophytocola sp.]
MTPDAMRVLAEPDRLREALTPLRRRLLERLRTPASATELAAELELPRQKLNYHLRVLERAGLVELVAERRRRGCTERILRASADAFVVDPTVLNSDEQATFTAIGDRYAAEHLVGVAADTVRQVARMRTAAERAGTRLLTFTLEADIRFAQPADVHRFADALHDAVARTAAEFDRAGGRSYRIVVGGHPTPKETGND